MSRPRTPQQFILDEETDFELTEVKEGTRHSRSSSNDPDEDSMTESLLLPSEKPPPKASTSTSFPPTSRQSHFTISIPSRTSVTQSKRSPKSRPKHLKFLLIGFSSLLLFAWSSTEVLTRFTRFGGAPKIQVILMISNGMGPASETFARSYLQYLYDTNSTTIKTGIEGKRMSLLNESVWNDGLSLSGKDDIKRGGLVTTPLDNILVGTVRTRSSNSLITDSAASSTSLSCLLKTYNGAIATTPFLTPCGTILESAHHQGFSTGLVTNLKLTNPSLSSFYGHSVDKNLGEGDLAKFLNGRGAAGGNQGKVVDLALGGGKCWFLGNETEGSCRRDGDDLLLKDSGEVGGGIKLVEGMKGLRDWKDQGFLPDEKKKKKNVLGFFSNDDLDFEVDRQRTEHLIDEQPSLKELSNLALNYLTRLSSSTKGFFLLIQNGKIESSSQENDPISLLNEILSYFETVKLVKSWVKRQNEVEGIKTVLVSVSGYETGGLSLGRQLNSPETTSSPLENLWFPEVLYNSTHSTNYLGKLLTNRYPMVTRDWVITEIYEKGLGIYDSEKWELDELWQFRTDSLKASRVLADAISRRAQLGWSTSGNTGVDVNLYAYGHNSTGLKGCVDNTEVGEFIAHTMGLNLDANPLSLSLAIGMKLVVTLELNKNLKSWFNPNAGNITTNQTSSLKHYEGDF
ncbi:hypothetical protein JCM5350_003260 [Sporobolomyces pararoseus]